MDEGTSLGSILNDATPEPEAVAAEPVADTPQPEAEVAAQPRNPDGTFAPKGETAPIEEPGASPAPQINAEPPLEHPALIGERRRRQEAERERDELRQALARHQPQQQPQAHEPAGPPDRWEDPEGYDAWLIEQATAKAVTLAEQRMTASRLDASEAIARQKFEDFDEKLAKFSEIASVNPRIAQQMMAAPDPAAFAYDFAKRAIEVERYGTVDVEALRAKLREEIMAEETAKLPRPTVPTSLASERNVGTRSGPAWAGPKSLSDILS